MTQQPLFPHPPKLSARQQHVLELIDHEGATAQDIGHVLHRENGCRYCTPESACKYAKSNGSEVLEALRKKELLRRDKHHRYYPVGVSNKPSSQTDDFPEGF